MDQTLTQWINAPALRNPHLSAVAVAVAVYGVPLMACFVAVQWFSRNNRLHLRHTAISAGLAFFAGLGLNQMILLFVHRVRPYDLGVSHLVIAKSADWSFPSDHATAAAAIAAVFLIKGVTWRGAVLAVAALLIAWARVFVGVHYVLDVAGGALVGIAAAVAVAVLYRQGNRLYKFATAIL